MQIYRLVNPNTGCITISAASHKESFVDWEYLSLEACQDKTVALY